VRAVAGACSKNHVALLIPCHRVIRGTGELGGYRWGIERKRSLIDLERSARASQALAGDKKL
jgi:AraC family transcriptional regulator of adaptative response/methylated-DNA-[protein]-cysteine methyltransferase